LAAVWLVSITGAVWCTSQTAPGELFSTFASIYIFPKNPALFRELHPRHESLFIISGTVKTKLIQFDALGSHGVIGDIVNSDHREFGCPKDHKYTSVTILLVEC